MYIPIAFLHRSPITSLLSGSPVSLAALLETDLLR